MCKGKSFSKAAGEWTCVRNLRIRGFTPCRDGRGIHDNLEDHASSQFDRDGGRLLGLGTRLDQNGLAATSAACRLSAYHRCHHCCATGLASRQVQDIFQTSIAEGGPGLAPFETWVSATCQCEKVVISRSSGVFHSFSWTGPLSSWQTHAISQVSKNARPGAPGSSITDHVWSVRITFVSTYL
jgi:hypothetical protein